MESEPYTAGTDCCEPVRVMIVGPGPKTEGGITQVIRTIGAALDARTDVSYRWIATHRSGNVWQKIAAAAGGVFAAARNLSDTDIVHIHSACQYSFIRKSVFYWLARVWRKPVIWHLHAPNNDFIEYFGRQGLQGRYARGILARCERVIVLSDSWISLAGDILPGARIQAIYNPIPAVSDEDDIERGVVDQRILYLAHLIQRKGYPVLIEAFARVANDFPGSRLVFAGSGEVGEAEALCTKLGIRERVEFLGWIGEPARTEELEKAQIFSLPSYQEGLPMGILEAMAYSKAVVTTPVGGIPDLLKDRQNGILCEPGNVDQLADALSDLLADPQMCRKLGRAARAAVSTIAPQEIADQWVQTYYDIHPRVKTTRKIG